MRKIIALVLVCLMVLPAAAACKKKETVTLIADSQMALAYDKNLLTPKEAQTYQKQIEEAAGIKVKLSNSVSDDTNVIFGDLNCEACLAANSDLRVKDYVCGVYEGKYVVGARTAATLKSAIGYFIETILPQAQKGKLTLGTDANYAFLGEYRVNAISIGGVSLGRNAIVIPSDAGAAEYRIAVYLSQHIAKNTGYITSISYGKAPAGTTTEIRIGKELCTKAAPEGANDYVITGNGTVLEVAANSYFGYLAAEDALEQSVLITKTEKIDDASEWKGNGDKKMTAAPAHAGEVRIMVHNVYTGSAFYDGEGYSTEQRMQMATDIYTYYQPDVLGLQEVGANIRMVLKPMLLALGYREVSYTVSHTDTGDHTPLFYNPETVECLNSGYLWYGDIDYTSETYAELRANYPDIKPEDIARENYDVSKGFTWGIFRLKSTGEVFMAASTHLMWSRNAHYENNESVYGREINELARQVQACYIKEKLLTFAEEWLADNGKASGTMPIFFGGDLNTSSSATSFQLIGRDDDYTQSETLELNKSFVHCNQISVGDQADYACSHAYAHWNETLQLYDNPTYSNNDYNKSSIDHIFTASVARSNLRVERFCRVGDLWAHLLSDHCPLFTDVTLYP